jgi:23S rRNA (guanosine2251-2'-O)-methyltransferase
MQKIILIAHNLRSTHNVGSLLRTCEGLGVSKVILTGYTPYPKAKEDPRLPHEAIKTAKQIHKTALGAEELISWEHSDDIFEVIKDLRVEGYKIIALEQAVGSILLPELTVRGKVALIVGREVEGLESEVMDVCDLVTEIPMVGKKESFNVTQASAMALYQLRFAGKSEI